MASPSIVQVAPSILQAALEAQTVHEYLELRAPVCAVSRTILKLEADRSPQSSPHSTFRKDKPRGRRRRRVGERRRNYVGQKFSGRDSEVYTLHTRGTLGGFWSPGLESDLSNRLSVSTDTDALSDTGSWYDVDPTHERDGSTPVTPVYEEKPSLRDHPAWKTSPWNQDGLDKQRLRNATSAALLSVVDDRNQPEDDIGEDYHGVLQSIPQPILMPPIMISGEKSAQTIMHSFELPASTAPARSKERRRTVDPPHAHLPTPTITLTKTTHDDDRHSHERGRTPSHQRTRSAPTNGHSAPQVALNQRAKTPTPRTQATGHSAPQIAPNQREKTPTPKTQGARQRSNESRARTPTPRSTNPGLAPELKVVPIVSRPTTSTPNLPPAQTHPIYYTYNDMPLPKVHTPPTPATTPRTVRKMAGRHSLRRQQSLNTASSNPSSVFSSNSSIVTSRSSNSSLGPDLFNHLAPDSQQTAEDDLSQCSTLVSHLSISVRAESGSPRSPSRDSDSNSFSLRSRTPKPRVSTSEPPKDEEAESSTWKTISSAGGSGDEDKEYEAGYEAGLDAMSRAETRRVSHHWEEITDDRTLQILQLELQRRNRSRLREMEDETHTGTENQAQINLLKGAYEAVQQRLSRE